MSLRVLKFMLAYAMGFALILLAGCDPSPVESTSAIGVEKQVLATGVIFTREGGLQLNYDPQQGATFTRIDDEVIFETSDEELPLYYMGRPVTANRWEEYSTHTVNGVIKEKTRPGYENVMVIGANAEKIMYMRYIDAQSVD